MPMRCPSIAVPLSVEGRQVGEIRRAVEGPRSFEEPLQLRRDPRGHLDAVEDALEFVLFPKHL
eukprot:533558-Pyramimonas_sp.AAC.1